MYDSTIISLLIVSFVVLQNLYLGRIVLHVAFVREASTENFQLRPCCVDQAISISMR